MPSGYRKPTTADLREALPEARDLLMDEIEYRWASEENAGRVADALQAARSAEALGYPHHVEMHLVRALAIFREDHAAGGGRV